MTGRALILAADLLAAACLAAVLGIGDAPDATGSTATHQSLVGLGAQLYAADCSACHGVGGAGKMTPGPAAGPGDLAGIGPSLQGVGALAADFYLSTGYMPLHNPYVQPRRSRVLYSDREVHALVAYVASLGPGPAVPNPDPALGSVSDGMRLFTENCAGCHQVVTAGGYVPDSVAPPLSPNSPQQIAEAVRIGPNLMPRFSPDRLSDRQLDSIIAYIRYARAPDDRGGYALGHVGPVPEGLVAWFIAGVVLVGVTLTAGRRLT
jgi:ubiquinol-cytochrome c reductase cytochrome c subunit